MLGDKLGIKRKKNLSRRIELSPVLPSYTVNVLGHKVEKDSVKQSTFLTAKVKLCTEHL